MATVGGGGHAGEEAAESRVSARPLELHSCLRNLDNALSYLHLHPGTLRIRDPVMRRSPPRGRTRGEPHGAGAGEAPPSQPAASQTMRDTSRLQKLLCQTATPRESPCRVVFSWGPRSGRVDPKPGPRLTNDHSKYEKGRPFHGLLIFE